MRHGSSCGSPPGWATRSTCQARTSSAPSPSDGLDETEETEETDERESLPIDGVIGCMPITLGTMTALCRLSTGRMVQGRRPREPEAGVTLAVTA